MLFMNNSLNYWMITRHGYTAPAEIKPGNKLP
jgi:hypothetical protein